MDEGSDSSLAVVGKLASMIIAELSAVRAASAGENGEPTDMPALDAMSEAAALIVVQSDDLERALNGDEAAEGEEGAEGEPAAPGVEEAEATRAGEGEAGGDEGSQEGDAPPPAAAKPEGGDAGGDAANKPEDEDEVNKAAMSPRELALVKRAEAAERRASALDVLSKSMPAEPKGALNSLGTLTKTQDSGGTDRESEDQIVERLAKMDPSSRQAEAIKLALTGQI